MEAHILDTIDPQLLGNRIAESRRARRLTQQQVADALNLSRSTIIAMEKGDRRPKARELVALAKLFGRPVDDFVANDSLAGEPSFSVLLRQSGNSANPEKAAKRAQDIETFERFCRWYVELEEMLGSPLPQRYPEPYSIEGTPPERAAAEVANSERNRLGLGDGPVNNLMDLLETDVGLRIFAFSMKDSSITGMFVHTDHFGSCIAVNASHPEARRRWSVAHAYAHFLTGRQHAEILELKSRQRISREERFADAFASNFLIPASGLMRRFEAIRRSKPGKSVTPTDVLTLTSLYGVSLQAMVMRLENLKLLSPGARDQMEQVDVSYERSCETPLRSDEPSAPKKLTTRYTTLTVEAFEEGLLTEGQLAERLGTDRLGARAVVSMVTSYYRTANGENSSPNLAPALTGAE